MFLNVLVASLLFPLAALAGSHNIHLNRAHSDIARRVDGNVQLYKRTNGRFSFYNTETGNAGSCGTFLTNGGFTVAVNVGQMNPSLCFKSITISYGGKSTTATIADTCPGCPWGGLDLSPGLFSFFAPQSVGIIYGDWEMAGAAPPPPPPPPPPPAPKPSPKPSPKPTTTPPPPPKTTSTKAAVPKVTSTSTSTSSSSTTTSKSADASLHAGNSTSSVNYNIGPASGLASPTGTIDRDPTDIDNLVDLAQAFIRLGALAVAANGV